MEEDDGATTNRMPNGRQERTLDLEMDDANLDRFEREMEGGGSGSDSGLDLHTPFA